MDKKKIIEIKAKLSEDGEDIDFYMLAGSKALGKIPQERIKVDLENMLKEVRVNTPFQMQRMFTDYSFVEKPEIPEGGNTIVEVNLPYCLHIPNGEDIEVNIPEKAIKAKVIFKKIWTTNSVGSSPVDIFAEDKITYYQKGVITTPHLPQEEPLGYDLKFTGENVERKKDNLGYFRYTKLQILFDTNYTKETLEKDKLETVHNNIKLKVSEIVNKILDVYRYVTKEDYIERLRFLNIMNVYFFTPDSGYYPIGMDIGGATMNRSKKEIKEMKDMLDNAFSPSLWELLLLDSKSSFDKKMFTLSLVSSFQGLEIFLEEFLVKKYTEEGLKEAEIDKKMNQYWKTKERLNDLLKETTNHSLSENVDLWDKWCTVYDKMRNEVIHKGKELTPEETGKALDANEKVIEWIQNLKQLSKNEG